MRISTKAIQDISEAVFSKEDPHVTETYSEFDAKPKVFSSAGQLANYITEKLDQPKGFVDLSIVYPEMGPMPLLRKVELDPKRVKGHSFRYTWDGWGLISMQLASPEHSLRSEISANSEARANKWSATHPEFGLPSEWNWAAVNKHKNRLKRVLKKHA